MECFQVVNSAIELVDFLVFENNLGLPSTYREIFELFYKNEIICMETLNDMKRWFFLRNMIAHEYYMIKEDGLKEMVNLLSCLDELVETAEKLNKIGERI